jgi:ribose 5-phosphate isomerase
VGIPLAGLKSELELTVDGADEVDPQLSLNKGYGGRSCERDRRGGREILGLKSGLRTDDGRPFVTDNWNVIIDLRIGLIADGPAVERSIRSIPGVVDTGSF